MPHSAMSDRETIEIAIDDTTFSGTYYVKRGMITVSYGYWQISTEIGGMPPASLARRLLRELLAGKPTD
jgi:hypothetical protein